LIKGIADTMAGTQAHPDGKCGTNDAENQEQRRGDDHRMAQVKLFHAARLAADKNDIHAVFSSNADIMLKTGGLFVHVELKYAPVR
jgi:hypothetical protein